ncbi:MAG: hybrid sensor histidine kinase/response regulator [Hyphomicrobiales bacterium]|nr:MAG: hybrid sensor histidine kinase/response regulator [Hyphomicrobiales bacterium]
MTETQTGEAKTAVLRDTEPRGRLWPIMLLAGVLALAAVGLAFLPGEQAEPIVLGILALLAVVGLLALFAVAAGLLRPGSGGGKVSLLKSVTDSALNGVLITDADNQVIYANPAYAEITEAGDIDEVRPIDRAFASHVEISDAIYRLARAADDGVAWQEDVRILQPGAGEPEPSWLRLSVRRMPFGKSHVSVWSVADVTAESERQESAFRELQKIIDYLDHAPTGFFSADGRGKVHYLNATLAEWLGIDLARTTGGNLDLKEIVAENGVHLLTGVKPDGAGMTTDSYDLDLIRADGSYRPVRVLHYVVFGEDGKALPSRSIVLDRRPGAGGTDSLRAAEARFSRFFNTAPIGIATLNGAGRIEMANGAFARIFKGLAISNRALTDLVAKDSRKLLTETLNMARTGSSGLAPVDVTIGNESAGNAQLIISRAGEKNHVEPGLIVFAIDTTEQRTLEMQFTQSQKMQAIGQLAGGVAHDFNNVLTSIIGFSDLLLANHTPTDPSFKDIINIKQSANRAAALVRQLLAFSRRQTLRPEVMSLNDVISDLTMMLDRLLGDKVELRLTHGQDLGHVRVDLHQFEQVIVNLAVNARDAMMPEGGTLSIKTYNVDETASRKLDFKPMPAGDYVVCEVSDTGSGMPKEVMDKIFEPFFTTKDVGEGTGLGLATVYGIIKQTGGFIFPESEVGEGTTFRVFLPRFEAEDEPEDEAADAEEKKAKEAEAAKQPRKDLTGSGTILLVEDEESLRAFAARALSSRGYTVIEAMNGENALELIEEGTEDIDLVISDVMMPEMDGPTLLKELRQRIDNFKVIFISGYAEDAFEKNLDESETFTFLPKPFGLKKLAETVKDVLES